MVCNYLFDLMRITIVLGIGIGMPVLSMSFASERVVARKLIDPAASASQGWVDAISADDEVNLVSNSQSSDRDLAFESNSTKNKLKTFPESPDNLVRLAQATEETAPTAPPDQQPAPTTPPTEQDTGEQVAGGLVFGVQPIIAVPQLRAIFGATSAGIDRFLIDVGATQGQKRQPTASENNLAGRRKGQTPGGSHWIPAREDLDTMLSKIDSRIVESVTVTKGPYNVMEGPGLAFYDVELLRAPRYRNGYESYGSSVMEYQTNGEQWYGRQSVWGGSYDWGYRIGYGHRTGSDYESGDGSQFIASYKSRMPDVALGADLTENSSVDFNYLRLDETDVEFAGQVFNIDFLVTDSYEVKYVLEDQPFFDRLKFETWYNRTFFEGPGKPIPSTNLLQPDETDVDSMSAGFLLAASWGCDCKYVTAGADFRYVKQRLNEFDFVSGNLFNFPIPRSHTSNPGLFAETQFSPCERVVIRSGGRVDWAAANADTSQAGTVYSLPLDTVLGGSFNQHFVLWSAFATIERDLGGGWTLATSAGHGMRPPTMTELYAIEPFLAVMPQFQFNKPFGNPLLAPERMWQVDLGLHHETSYVRGGIDFFHSWIQDYITFDASPSNDLTTPGQVPLNYTWVNTDLATLAGASAYCELEWTRCLTSFARITYIEGRDHSRRMSNSPIRARAAIFGNASPERSFATYRNPGTAEEPLPVIAPLESRVGVRFQPPHNSRVQMVFSARVVDNQDRVATSLFELPTPGFTTFDIRGQWWATERLLLTGGVENLSDKNYQEHFDPRTPIFATVFQPGKNFYFGAELNY